MRGSEQKWIKRKENILSSSLAYNSPKGHLLRLQILSNTEAQPSAQKPWQHTLWALQSWLFPEDQRHLDGLLRTLVGEWVARESTKEDSESSYHLVNSWHLPGLLY